MEPQIQRRRLFLAAGLLVLLFGVWHALKMTRYGYLSAGDGKMYRVDRWTDEVVYVEMHDSYRVEMPR